MKRMMIALCLALSSSIWVVTANADQQGLAIAQSVDREASGFGAIRASVKMLLINEGRTTAERRMTLSEREVTNEGDRSLMVFSFPGDVRGTAVLTHTKAKGPDDHWIYMPALKQVKRIASASQSAPFMGSEFAYEDLARQEYRKYVYSFLRNEKVGGRDFAVVERRADGFESGYSRQLLWVDAGEFRVERIDYYDRRNELVKRQQFSDFVRVGKAWFAKRRRMDNLKTKRATEVILTELAVDSSSRDADFTPAALNAPH